MDNDTLIATLVGAGIATLPILISNIVQIYLHVSEKRLKDKEARIQATEKVLGADIDKTLDLLADQMRALSEYRAYNDRRKRRLEFRKKGYLSQEEYDSQEKLDSMQFGNKIEAASFLNDALYMHVHSFDAELSVLYNNFIDYAEEFITAFRIENEIIVKWSDLLISAGKLHRMLRQKKMLIYGLK